MKNAVWIIGMGQMGGVFARGILKHGEPVVPVGRDDQWDQLKETYGEPSVLIVAVGEKDIQPVMASIPGEWADRSVLLQNELLPRDWTKHGWENPTVISVWFEKKYPSDYKVIIPSPAYGAHAEFLREALATIDIPVRVLHSKDDLLFELVLKNVYILTVNIAGLQVDGTVESLWKEHNGLARAVASDVMDLQFYLIGRELDRERLMEGMVAAFAGDWQHKCKGRSAPARLERALKLAEDSELPVQALKGVQEIYLAQK